MTSEETESRIRQVCAWPSSRRIAANLSLLENPPLFDLELVSTCNAACGFCPRDRMARRDRFISDETFDAVLEFLPEHAMVMLSGLGEATLHPRLETHVARLSDRGFSSCLVTNGLRLTSRLQDGLVAAGIAQVQVSLHGPPPWFGYPARAARDLEAHLEHLSGHRAGGLRVRVNFVETPRNRLEADRVRQWTGASGFSFFWRREHGRGCHGDTRPRSGTRSGCGIFASVTFITADGVLFPCVNDVAGRYRLGRVGRTNWPDLLEIKHRIVATGAWFDTCARCDDDYRWVLIGQGGLDG